MEDVYKVAAVVAVPIIIAGSALHGVALHKRYGCNYILNKTEKELRIYVADIPPAYANGTVGHYKPSVDEMHSYGAIGPLLSKRHDHWNTGWDMMVPWYINQIETSQLRVHDAKHADIVFVPAVLSHGDHIQQRNFISEAASFLPYLEYKPHLIVLSFPLFDKYYNKTLISHKNIVVIAVGQRGGLPTDIVTTAYFSHVHWSRGSEKITRTFNADTIVNIKKLLAVGCFNVRLYDERTVLYEDCNSRDKCTYMNYTSALDAVPVFEAYTSAWYVLHPVGDFLTRSALYDTWMADAIPVLFQPGYFEFLPFNDVLDYDKLVMHIPHREIVGEDRKNAIDLLESSFDEADALKRIKYIHKVKNVFQYMLNPAHELIRWDKRSTLEPQDDTFTFTMKSVLRHICSNSTITSNRRWDVCK